MRTITFRLKLLKGGVYEQPMIGREQIFARVDWARCLLPVLPVVSLEVEWGVLRTKISGLKIRIMCMPTVRLTKFRGSGSPWRTMWSTSHISFGQLQVHFVCRNQCFPWGCLIEGVTSDNQYIVGIQERCNWELSTHKRAGTSQEGRSNDLCN